MKTKTDIYAQVTNAIIAELENGIIPWQKPWQNGTVAGCISHTSGKPYSLLNQMLLGWRTGEWLTYGQIQAEGGRVKRGEKSSMVVFWSFVEKRELEAVCDENGDEIGTHPVVVDKYPILKSYAVFHIDQCEGIKPKYNNTAVTFEHDACEVADQIVADYVNREGLKLEIKNTNRACYSPFFDKVEVPEMKQYKIREEYYSTLFHELTHSTGHEKRLNRDTLTKLAAFGSETYSKEELVAEMGAAFLCNAIEISCEKAFKNSAAYIKGWLHALKDDKHLIISAASKAEAAANYIMNLK